MYQVKRPSRGEFVRIRCLDYHVRVWGQPQAGEAPLVMVHGWMDVAASYQFMVDAFAQDRYIIAPDWRGYGLTESGPVYPCLPRERSRRCDSSTSSQLPTIPLSAPGRE